MTLPVAKRSRAPRDPFDLKSVNEVRDLQPSLKRRLELGGWSAVHVRAARPERAGQRGGVMQMESVPTSAVYGWPDWVCLHRRESRPLVIELKSEEGKVTAYQRDWLKLWDLAGAEVALVRPRDVYCWKERADPVFMRLVEHRACPAECDGLGGCTGWCRALNEAQDVIKSPAPVEP